MHTYLDEVTIAVRRVVGRLARVDNPALGGGLAVSLRQIVDPHSLGPWASHSQSGWAVADPATARLRHECRYLGFSVVECRNVMDPLRHSLVCCLIVVTYDDLVFSRGEDTVYEWRLDHGCKLGVGSLGVVYSRFVVAVSIRVRVCAAVHKGLLDRKLVQARRWRVESCMRACVFQIEGCVHHLTEKNSTCAEQRQTYLVMCLY